MQGRLRGRTFSAPRKSIRGKGRVTVQFGCCYNYATDKQGRAPGKATPVVKYDACGQALLCHQRAQA